MIDEGRGELKADRVGRSWVLRRSVVQAFKDAKKQEARKKGTVLFSQTAVPVGDVEAFDALELTAADRPAAVGQALREYAERHTKK